MKGLCVDKFDMIIREMRIKIEKEKEPHIKPKKVCKICGKALSSINGEGQCFTHTHYESPLPAEEKNNKQRKSGINAKGKRKNRCISMQKL